MNTLVSIWQWIQRRYVPESLRKDSDLKRRAELTLALTGVGIVIAGTWAFGTLASGAWLEGAIASMMVAAGFLAPVLLRKTASLTLVGNYGGALWFSALATAAYGARGFGISAVVASAAVPMVSLLIAGWRSGMFWTGVTLLNAVAFALVDRQGWVVQRLAEERRIIDYASPILFILAVFCMSAAYESVKDAANRARAESDGERARAETDRAEAREEARLLRADRMASVGQLAAGVAHELNNPLAYVISNLAYLESALEGRERSAVLREAIEDAHEGARRMKGIIRDLNTFARPAREVVQPVELTKVVETALKMAKNQIRQLVRITRDYSGDPVVLADEPRLVQVFLNLVVNAAQALPDDDQEHEIRVSLTQDDGVVMATVTDTGLGIAPAVLERVTEPFFTTKPVGIGTGLGLSVCRNLVESYGGQLKIESALGKGTSVSVSLPASERRAASEPPEGHFSGVIKKRRSRVLIIDDDSMVRKALARTLGGHDVTAVGDGREALRLLEGGARFDVIFCDVMMPDLTGPDVYLRARAAVPGVERSIVFMTGGTFDDRTREFLDGLPNRRLDKPFTLEDVELVIAEAPTTPLQKKARR